jgi:very-short-patch-repair endonuclease
MRALASRQRGNVTRRQLVARGVTKAMIRRRRANGSLIEVFPDVFLVGHTAEPPLSREHAALLYCSPRAMLSHRTAGHAFGWPIRRPRTVDVTTAGRQLRSRPGLRTHTIKDILPFELRHHCGMPITSPSLTLLDLGGILGEAGLAGCLNEARVQDQVTDDELHATLRAHPNRRGARALRKLLAREESEFAVESEAERLCLKLMIEYGLKPDAAGAWVGGYRVDFLYETERLAVEVDGYRYHRTRERFVGDRRRRAHLMALGYEVFVVSWADLTDQSRATMTRLGAVRTRRRESALREKRSQRARTA